MTATSPRPADDLRHMHHALALGRRGMGQVWPNPAVGCVIVKNGRIIGRGWTQEGGRPHAEAMALAQAGEGARGATAYVTLEPCAHQSPRGPSCASSLVAAGVARVVGAIEDPDPRTAGQGFARLRAAGITVDTGLAADQARHDHAGFIKRVTAGLPWVTLKLAATLDGRIATATGESQWITGPQARQMVHLMRAQHDAVMVGAGTARQDDPLLNVRGFGLRRQPVRIVWSRGLDIPTQSKLVDTAADIPLWLVHGTKAGADSQAQWSARGALTIAIPDDRGGLDPVAALQSLAAQGLTRIFCEGGGHLAATLLKADLVDELAVFSAGAVIGADGRPMMGDMGLTELAAAPRFRLHDFHQIGGDILHIWRRDPPPQAG